MPKKLPFETFRMIYSQVPRLCVEVVLQTPKGILLTKRSIEPYKGMWHLPGGTVLFGETMEEAVVRVAKEEVNVTVTDMNLIAPLYYKDEEKVKGYGWTISIAFNVDGDYSNVQGSEQGEEFAFFLSVPDNTVSDQKTFLESSVIV